MATSIVKLTVCYLFSVYIFLCIVSFDICKHDSNSFVQFYSKLLCLFIKHLLLYTYFLQVFRLLRSLRPLRVINRAPGLKLVVQTLLSSLRPIGNIVLICCTFFIIFGILGVQLFKGAFYHCDGPEILSVRNKSDCLADKRNIWVNRKYNFDDLGKALMSLFVLSSRDGWVNIMYTGLDAVGVDQQVRVLPSWIIY